MVDDGGGLRPPSDKRRPPDGSEARDPDGDLIAQDLAHGAVDRCVRDGVLVAGERLQRRTGVPDFPAFAGEVVADAEAGGVQFDGFRRGWGRGGDEHPGF